MRKPRANKTSQMTDHRPSLPPKAERPIQDSDARGFRLAYRPSLDGLRGIAVLAVMAFHVDLLRGGFLGVDVFFVLSGFLITTLLLQEWTRYGRISLGYFYARRALRLLPALLTLLVIWLLFVTYYKHSIINETRKAILTTLFYCSNLVSTFKWRVWLGPLSHTWSLSIEEQFYLIWPILLITMLRLRLKPHRILLITILCASASAVARGVLWAGGSDADRLYHGTDTRAEALLVGCAVGLLATSGMLFNQRWLNTHIRCLSLCAAIILLLLGAGAKWDAAYMYLGLFSVAAVAVALILIRLIVSPPKLALSILESCVLVWIGRLSYGLYLWHLPVNEIVKTNVLPEAVVLMLRIGATFAAASLSFYLIEQPCLRRKRGFERNAAPQSLSARCAIESAA